MPFPGDPKRYPHRDEVVEYLAKYAAELDAQIAVGSPVVSVAWDGGVFALSTPNSTFRARRVVNATGGFATPHLPALPGLDTFTDTVSHSAQYAAPRQLAGQHVVVVGAGNSAVQIATELATVARVTLTSRAPVKFLPQRSAGRDIHDWLA